MGELVYLFPGQGSQKVGMGLDLYRSSEKAREVFDRADQTLGFKLSRIMFEGSEDELTKTAHAQPAILTHSIATLRCLEERGLPKPSMVAGHSLGEYSALVACASISFEDAVKAVHFRGQAMQDAVPIGLGAMAAVLGLEAAEIRSVCHTLSSANPDHYVAVANFNGPVQTVISGTALGVEKATHALKQAGARRILPLAVSAPFHCALMSSAKDKLSTYFDGVTFRHAECPVVNNVTGKLVSDANTLRQLLVEQVVEPVQFTEMVECLRRENIRTFVEIGPGKTLVGIVKRMIEDARLLNAEDHASINDVVLAAMEG